VHELSIAHSLIDVAQEAIGENQHNMQVMALRVRIGALSGVVKDALIFAWDIATEGTVLQGTQLKIEDVPIAIFCPVCQEERTLTDSHIFRCPICNTKSGDIRHGRELELVALEVSS